MNLRALLLCSDDHIVKVMGRVLADLDIAVEHCVDHETAVNLLLEHHFDAVIVDCDDESSASVALQTTRSAVGKKKPLVLAIVPAQVSIRATFSLGASFVLYKPVSLDRARASLRAARGLMCNERRSNLRIPVQLLTAISYRGASEVSGSMFDLSEAGAAVQTRQDLNGKGPLSLQFTLPRSAVPIRATGEVIWHDKQGRCGIRFMDVPVTSRHMLREWLSTQAQQHKPNVVAAVSAIQ